MFHFINNRGFFLCVFIYKRTECRQSGPGADYGGTKEITRTRSKCKTWHKRLQLKTGEVRELIIFLI